MEIDITDFVMNEEPFNYSASAAEMGTRAGQITWLNAKEEGARKPLLTTEEQLQALRDHVEDMGFGGEVQGYDANACNALFIQLISGDMREAGMDDVDLEDFDWTEYTARSEQGQVSGSIYRGDNGRIYYYLGS